MQTYQVFLASSAELEQDRIAFGDAVQELNDRLFHEQRQVHFTLYKWERETVSFTERRKQDVYNTNITTCNIFVLLYWSKVGLYTEEEYDFAWSRFITEGVPQIIVFAKTEAVTKHESVAAFKKKIGERDQQYASTYADSSALRVHFFNEIGKLFSKGILQYGVPAETIYTDGNSVPVGFIGRQQELSDIRERLEAGGKLMLINAEGGIGKTSLAAKYWAEGEHRYKYNAWLFCEGGIVSSLKKLAPRLSIDLAGKNEAEQIEALRNGLLGKSPDMLLVLDNANTPEDIDAFTRAFDGFKWSVLITSRCNGILKGQELHITHLPPPLAKALFVSNYKEDTPEFDALLDRLLEALHYHTLLIEIFSKNMRHLSELGETLANFLQHLEGDNLFLAKRSFEIRSPYGTYVHKTASTTDEILEILYDFGKLEEAERYCLVNLSLIPAVSYTLLFLADLLKVEDKYTFKRVLQALTERGWLIKEETGYRISHVLQKLVLKKHESNLQQDSEVMIDNLNEKLGNDGLYLINSRYDEAAPFVQLIAAITAHLAKQPFYALGLLNDRACVYFLATGDLLEAEKAAENYKSVGSTLNDRNGIAIANSRLGDIYSALGALDSALEAYEKYNILEKKLYEENQEDSYYKNVFAISCQKLGNTYGALGNLDKAMEFYQQDNTLSKQLRESNYTNVEFKNALAISCQNLAKVYFDLGNADKALDFFRQDYDLEEELHNSDPANIAFKHGFAISCQNLGNTYRMMGDLEKALLFYQKYNSLEKQLHEDSPVNVTFLNAYSISCFKLGTIYEKMDDLEEAFKSYRQYYTLAKQLHENNLSNINFKNNLAYSCYTLGSFYEQKREIGVAKRYYIRAEVLLEEVMTISPQHAEYNGNLYAIKKILSNLSN